MKLLFLFSFKNSRSEFKIPYLKKTVSLLMPKPFQWYYSLTELIWPDGNFKLQKDQYLNVRIHIKSLSWLRVRFKLLCVFSKYFKELCQPKNVYLPHYAPTPNFLKCNAFAEHALKISEHMLRKALMGKSSVRNSHA